MLERTYVVPLVRGQILKLGNVPEILTRTYSISFIRFH